MKLVKRLLLVAVVAAVLLLVAGWLLVTPASRAAVEKGGRFALGVDTTLGDVVLSPSLGRSALGFTGLEVANPDGIAGDPFLSIGEFQVGVRTLSLMSSTVRVPDIVLEDLHLRLIQDGKRSNFKEILDHVRGLGGGGGGGAAPAADAPEGSAGPTLALGRLKVAGVSTSLELRGMPGLDEPLSHTFELPAFELDLAEALGATEGGGDPQGSVGDVTAAVVDEILALALAEAKKHVDPEVMALIEGDLGDALEQRAKEEADGLLDDAKEELDEKLEGELGGKLKGLLGDD